jgi:hypothetical protein
MAKGVAYHRVVDHLCGAGVHPGSAGVILNKSLGVAAQGNGPEDR